MEYYNNSQDVDESLDRIHPEWPGRYVLVDTEKGSVVWFDTHDAAVKNQSLYGGIVINTATADPEFVKLTLANARRNM